MTFFDILIRGGILMIPIAIASVVGIAIIIAKFIMLKECKIEPEIMMQIEQKMRKGDKEGLLEIAKIYGNEKISKLIETGVLYGEDAMRVMITDEITYANKYMGGLATIIGIAPLLGFLGTVTGMIRAFMRVQELGGNVNASVLAGGIWEALVTTAAGLAVAIIMYIFYNYFVGKIKTYSQKLRTIEELLTK